MKRPNLFPVVRCLCAMLLALAAAGCTMKTDGTTSSVTVNMPGSVPAHPAITPGAIAAASASGPPPSGRFSGIGRLTSSAGSGCRNEITISPMIVSGNQVRYLGFRGTIQSDAFVRMQSGGAFIYGIFDGDRFTGHLWRAHPDCTYDLALAHVG
jgi:hypothetical protein